MFAVIIISILFNRPMFQEITSGHAGAPKKSVKEERLVQDFHRPE